MMEKLLDPAILSTSDSQLRTTVSHRKSRVHLLLFVISFLTLCAIVKQSWTQRGHALPFNITQYKQPAKSLNELKDILLKTPDSQKIRSYSLHYTAESHLPGEGYELAGWTQARWQEFGIKDAVLTPYSASLVFPGHMRLALLDLNKTGHDQVLYEAALVEDPAFAARTPEGKQPFIRSFHGRAPDGNVTASFVYANFGSEEDFRALNDANVTLEGKIAIVKVAQVSPYLESTNMNLYRSIPITYALSAGMVGVIMYADPQNDAGMVESKGHKPFPFGPARPATTIERGTLSPMKLDPKVASDNFPSAPISYDDAVPLLRALNGHGPQAKDLPTRWHGGGLGYRGIQYNIGPSPGNMVLNLDSKTERTTGLVHNVIGKIEGAEFPNEVIIVGNHRDAWGPGAGDPGSGSSALNEVVRSFGVALKTGWRPLRTIVFASFEGEEIGQVGSRPWLAENIGWLNASAVAYLNVVVAGTGSKFHLKASPLLHKTAKYALSLVTSPNQTVLDQTVLDVWDGVISPAGGGDAIPFTCDYAISSVDFGFSPAINEPIFPYHSQFDNVQWIDAYGDPTWEYHATTAKIWSMMILHLVESTVLPISVADYATTLDQYLRNLRQTLPPELANFKFEALEHAIHQLHQAATRFDSHAVRLKALFDKGCQWWRLCPKTKLMSQIRATNQIYITFERSFLDERSGPSSSLSHVIFEHAAWHHSEKPFPGLVRAVEDKSVIETKEAEKLIAERVNVATNLLENFLGRN